MILKIIFLLLIMEYFFEYLLFSKYNQKPLSIQTFEGSDNQPYHPSVLFFDKGWNNYRYWMVETPYPIGALPYRDRWECPTIHVSNDGIHWLSTHKDALPIDDLTEDEIIERDFFSDPHLVFHQNRLYCYYRFSQKTRNGYHTFLLRKYTYDGINWSERETLLDLDSESAHSSVGNMVRSHAIIFEDGVYRMWYVDNVNPKGKKNVCMSTSIDGYKWDKKIICNLSGKVIEPWHLDVTKIQDKYILTIYDFHSLSLWEGVQPTRFVFNKTLLCPSFIRGCFYSDGLYRSSLIKDDKGTKLYFSAYNQNRTSIGLMEGPTYTKLKVSSYAGRKISIFQFISVYLWIWKKRLWVTKQLFMR